MSHAFLASPGEDIPLDALTLESQEDALTEIADLIAQKAAAADVESAARRRELDLLRARWWVVKRNVVELRRRYPRINCVLSDGSKIYDLEVVSGC